MLSHTLRLAALASAFSTINSATALDFPANDPDALSSAVKQISTGVIDFDVEDYGGVGNFPDPYTWTESATAWDSLVEYWYLTGDASHNAAVQAALMGQIGPDEDYMPPNQSLTLSNHGQARWALTALSAAELGFPVVGENKTVWEDLARDVFETQVPRWDEKTCGGGLRQQIFTFNDGHDTKDTFTQGTFFQLAARLAHFTGNQTYVDWAVRAYDWMREAKLIDEDFHVLNFVNASDNCSVVYHDQWSEPAASIAYGCAILANITSDAEWANRTTSHVDKLLDMFFQDSNNTMTEPMCQSAREGGDKCRGSTHSNIASALHWLKLIPVFQPATYDGIHTALDATAAAAAPLCTVEEDGNSSSAASCRGLWTSAADDDDVYEQEMGDDPDCARCEQPRNVTRGLGQQLTALEALQSAFVLLGGDGAGVNASFVLRTVNGTPAAGGVSTSEDGGDGGNGSTGTDDAATGAAAGGGLTSVSSSLVMAALVGMGMALL